MVAYLRWVTRLKAFAAVTGALFLAHAATVPLLRLAGLRPAAARWSSRIFRAWARCVATILGMRIRVAGRPPRAPFFLVSNHLGYVDLLVFASVLDCVFVARADAALWPLFGVLCRTVGTIFIDRESKADIPRVISRIERAMGDGRGVVVFPEGTSTGGSTVLRFRPSLFETAVRTGVPVSCASVTYRTPTWGPPASHAVCWWGDAAFGEHLLGLFRLRGFVAKVTFGREPIEEGDRKELATKARQAVLRHFHPVAS